MCVYVVFLCRWPVTLTIYDIPLTFLSLSHTRSVSRVVTIGCVKTVDENIDVLTLYLMILSD